MSELVLKKKENGIATVTLNRPELGNAFANESYIEVRKAIEEFGMDDEVRVIILTGAGKNFSAGGDINGFKELQEKGINEAIAKRDVVIAGQMSDAVLRCPKPVIAMVNGAAAGAGCALALACDFRVMAPESRLIMAFINVGFSGDTGAIYLLERLVGMARTKELMALGTPVSAEQAYTIGLANRVSDSAETLEETTMKLAKQLINRPGKAIEMQKRLCYEFMYRDLTQFNIREADYMYACGLTKDHAEAVNAFLEKRKPVFTGK